MSTEEPRPAYVLAAALAAWAITAAIWILLAPPLRGDEPTYAILARGDGPLWLYRSRGIVAIARLGIEFGASDRAMRITSAVLSLGMPLSVYAYGRVLAGPRTGAWAAAVIAGAHPFVLRAAQLLGDLPAAAATIAAVALVQSELSRADGPRYRLAWAGPLLATSLYLRYGNALVIAVIALATLAFWHRAIRKRPGPLLLAAAAFLVSLVPFFAMSIRDTGSPLGILVFSHDMANHFRAYPGAGLVGYIASDPLLLYGVLPTPLILLGLVAMRGRAHGYAVVIALGQIVAVGITIHTEARYVYVAAALLATLGAAVAIRAFRRVGVALAAAAWLGCTIVTTRHLLTLHTEVAESSLAIRDDVGGRPCIVFAPVAPPRQWYSGCTAVPLAKLPDTPVPAGQPIYVSDIDRTGGTDGVQLAQRVTGRAAVKIAPYTWRL